MTRSLAISDTGLRLIKAFEGFRPEDRVLVTGIRIVGYGHRLGVDADPVKMTRAEAEDQLLDDLEMFEDAVNEEVHAPLTQGQYDALVSLAFNIGLDAFRKSGVVRALNNGRVLDAANGFDVWRKATVNGKTYVVDALMRRRTAEKSLFLRNEPAVPAPSAVLVPEQDPSAPFGLTDDGFPNAHFDASDGLIEEANIINAENMVDVADDADIAPVVTLSNLIDPTTSDLDDEDDLIDEDDLTDVGFEADDDPFDADQSLSLDEDDGLLDGEDDDLLDDEDDDLLDGEEDLDLDDGFRMTLSASNEGPIIWEDIVPGSVPVELDDLISSSTDSMSDAGILTLNTPVDGFIISASDDEEPIDLTGTMDGSDFSLLKADDVEVEEPSEDDSVISSAADSLGERLSALIDEKDSETETEAKPDLPVSLFQPATVTSEMGQDETNLDYAVMDLTSPSMQESVTEIETGRAETDNAPENNLKVIDDLAADDVIRASRDPENPIFDPEGDPVENAMRYLERKSSEAEPSSSGSKLWIPMAIGALLVGVSAVLIGRGATQILANWGPTAAMAAAITGGLTLLFALYATARSKMV